MPEIINLPSTGWKEYDPDATQKEEVVERSNTVMNLPSTGWKEYDPDAETKKAKTEDVGVLDAAGKGIVSGITQLGEAINTGVEYLGNRIGSEKIASIGKENVSEWNKMGKPYETPKSIQGNIVDKPELLADPSWWAYNVAQTGVSMVPGMIAGAGIGGVAAKGVQVLGKVYKWTPKLVENLQKLSFLVPAGLVGGAQEGASTYQEVIKRGGTEEQAARAMEAMTTASGVLNAVSFGKMFDVLNPKQKTGIMNYVRHVLEGGATESITEYLEEPTEVLIKLGLIPDKFTKEEAVEQLKSGVNVVPAAFVTGGIVSGVGANVGKGVAEKPAIKKDEPTDLLKATQEEPEEDTRPAFNEGEIFTKEEEDLILKPIPPVQEEVKEEPIVEEKQEVITNVPEQEEKTETLLEPNAGPIADQPSVETVTNPSEVLAGSAQPIDLFEEAKKYGTPDEFISAQEAISEKPLSKKTKAELMATWEQAFEEQGTVVTPEQKEALSKEFPTGEEFLRDRGYKLPKMNREKNPAKWFELLYKNNPELTPKVYQEIQQEWQDTSAKSLQTGKNLFKEPEVTKPVETKEEKISKVQGIKPRTDLIPGWEVKYDNKQAEDIKTDPEARTITFKKRKEFENPAKVNDEIATVAVSNLPQGLIDEYAEVANVNKETSKPNLHMAVYYGSYLNGLEVPQNIKDFFEKKINKEFDGIMKEAASRLELAKGIVVDITNGGKKVYTIKGNKGSVITRIARPIREFMKGDVMELVGQVASNVHQLAKIAQIYTDERVETFRYIFVNDQGTILSPPNGFSCRLPGVTKMQKGSNGRKLAHQLNARARRLGATGVYFMHNHPSGDPRPSDADQVNTARFINHMDEVNLKSPHKLNFKGHLIIDDTKYSVVFANGAAQTYLLDQNTVEKFGQRKELPPIAGVPSQLNSVNYPELAKLAKDLNKHDDYVVVFYLAANSRISGVQDVHKNQIKSKDANNFLRGQARKFGATDIIVYAKEVKDINVNIARDLIRNGSVFDVLYGEVEDTTVSKEYPGERKDARRNELYFGKSIDEYTPKAEEESGLESKEEKINEEAPSAADVEREGYANAKPHIWETPEMVELIRGITGKFPRLRKALGKQLGAFRDKEGTVDILANLSHEDFAKVLAHNIGHLSEWIEGETLKAGNLFAKIGSINGYFKSLLAEYRGAEGQPLTEKDRERLRREAQKEAEKQTGSIFSYITKQVPEYETVGITPKMVLDLLRGITNEPKAVLDFLKKIDGPEKAKVVRQAFKDVVDERIAELEAKKLKGYRTVTEVVETPGEDLNSRISKLFHEKLQSEIEKRKLFTLSEVEAELKELSRKWNKFEPRKDDYYTDLRFMPSELYADAVSVLFNDPEMLKNEAPTFWKAFHNYLEARPSFKKKYDEINERLNDKDAVMKNRQDFLEGMSKKGAERRAILEQMKEAKERITGSKILHEFQKLFSGEDVRYRDTVVKWIKEGKYVPDEYRIDYLIEELPRISSEIYVFFRETLDTAKSIVGSGISMEKLHAFMTLERAAFEENRKKIQSPGGISGTLAEDQLAYMEKELGSEQFKKLKDGADKLRRIYKKNVIDVVVKENFFPKKLNDYMLSNDYYVTFDFLPEDLSELDKRYGGQYSAEILNQYGGLGEISNVVIATMLKGGSLLRAARYHETKYTLLKALVEMNDNPEGDVIIAKRQKGGQGWENAPEGYGPIDVSPQGKHQRYFIDKELADVWNKDHDRFVTLIKVGMLTKSVISKLFIEWNAAWTVANPIRDIHGTWKKLPGGTDRYFIPALLKTWKEAWAVSGGEMTEREAKLLRTHATSPGRFYNPSEVIDELLSGLNKKYMVVNEANAIKEQNEFMKSINSVFEWLKKPENNKYFLLPPYIRFIKRFGQAGERWTKFAADEAMAMYEKETGAKYNKRYKTSIVASRSGTPDSMRRGTAHDIMEFLFPFSTVAIQDMVSGYKAAKERPAAYFTKTIISNVMPKLFLAACAVGWIGYDDDSRETMKRLSRKVSTYFRRLYTVIPVAEVGGQAVFLKIPQDYTGQAIGAIVDAALSREISGVTGALGAVAGYQPYNLNPFIGVLSDISGYYTKGVVPVNFYGSQVMSPTVASAGGTEAAKALARLTWNEFMGGLVLKIETSHAERVEPKVKEIFKYPPFNVIPAKFVGITDIGEQEAARKAMQKVKGEESKDKIRIQEAANEIINKYHGDTAEDKMYELYWKFVDDGVINPRRQSAKAFVKNYMVKEAQTTGSSFMIGFSRCETVREKANEILRLERVYGKDNKYYKDFINEIEEKGLMTKEVYIELDAQRALIKKD